MVARSHKKADAKLYSIWFYFLWHFVIHTDLNMFHSTKKNLECACVLIALRNKHIHIQRWIPCRKRSIWSYRSFLFPHQFSGWQQKVSTILCWCHRLFVRQHFKKKKTWTFPLVTEKGFAGFNIHLKHSLYFFGIIRFQKAIFCYWKHFNILLRFFTWSEIQCIFIINPFTVWI